MCDREVFSGDGIQIVALNRLARRKSDRVNQNIETPPALLDCLHQRRDLRVFGDVADGFGGGTTREQRLEIMRDSRIGTYGTIALLLTFIGKAAIYETLIGADPITIIALLASAAAFSRGLVVDLMWATRPARSDGLSVFAGRPGKRSALFSLVSGGLGAVLATSLVLSPAAAAVSMLAAFIVLAIMRALAMRQIGGQTGDVCGATQVLTELAMLAVYAAMIG